MRSLVGAVLSLLMGSSCSFGFAADYRVSGPVKCNNPSQAPSCGTDLTLSEAQQSFAKEKSEITKCLAEKSSKKGDGFQLPGLFSQDKCSMMTLAVLGNLCDRERTIGGEDNYFWSPVSQFTDGNATLETLLKMAKDGQAHDGHMVIGTADSTVQERHLALCAVASVRGSSGPPRACVTVAIVTPNATWLRGGYSNGFCTIMAVFRPTGAIGILFEVVTPQGADTFSPALTKMMADMGLAFELQARTKTSLRLRSVAGLRTSTVLKGGWKEALDFDIDLDREGDRILVNGGLHVMVCRQALGNLDQYQGLDDVQRSIFAQTFDSNVKAALKSSCKSVIERDAKTMTCQ